jgi:urease accessory protein
MTGLAAAPDLRLLRVLQLASQALPIGAYACSQGLEWAVEAGWVRDADGLCEWLRDALVHALAATDVPLLARLHAAAGDAAAMEKWNAELLAMRETHELLTDDCDRGRALARLLRDLGIASAQAWAARTDTAQATAFALALVAWDVPLATGAVAYCWSWLENQVLAGVKLVPLGQVAGQRVLLSVAERIPAIVARGLVLSDDELGGTLPAHAIASSRHETQYTRLFRS